VSDIDKAVELARTFCDECVGGEGCTCDMCIIARAVLAMSPVVVAARAMADVSKAYWQGGASSEDFARLDDALVAAVRALDAEARRG